MSLTIRVCLHSFSHYWLPNLRNSTKFLEKKARQPNVLRR